MLKSYYLYLLSKNSLHVTLNEPLVHEKAQIVQNNLQNVLHVQVILLSRPVESWGIDLVFMNRLMLFPLFDERNIILVVEQIGILTVSGKKIRSKSG